MNQNRTFRKVQGRLITGIGLSAWKPSELRALAIARRLIAENLNCHYSIAEIAVQVQLNECKLKKGFRLVHGRGMFAYLIKCRMEYAALLLTKTDWPLKAIAAHCGYSRLSNFITAFQRYYSCTPGFYKKQYPLSRTHSSTGASTHSSSSSAASPE